MNKREICKRMLVILVTLTMILNCLGIGGSGNTPRVINAQELATATDSEVSASATGENEGESFSYENIYNSENFDVSFKLDNKWDTGYNATITITNTSDSVIENWCLTFPLSETISNIWNATVSKTHEDFYVIKNAGWNQDIAVGGSVSFGLTVYEPFTAFPEYYTIIGNQVETKSEDYTIDYKVTEDWGDGYKAEVTITNNKDTAIEDWRLSFTYGDNLITQIWNAVILGNAEGKYEISCETYNQNIAPGASITFGFMVEPGCSGGCIEKVKVWEVETICGDDNKEEYRIPILQIKTDFLEYDKDYGLYYTEKLVSNMYVTLENYEDVTEVTYTILSQNGITVMEGDVAVDGLLEIDNIGLTYGKNIFKISASCYGQKLAEEELMFYNFSMDNLENVNVENEKTIDLGNEVLLSDYDGDGVCDYYENEVLGLNMFEPDSDGDDIKDGEEDYDEDGISNQEEIERKLNPLEYDTDADGICDGEEVYVIGTKAELYDTDGDGCSDQWEVENGYNPILFDNNFSGLVLGDYKETVVSTVNVEIENASGNAINSLKICAYEDEVLSHDMKGYVDKAIEFRLNGDFEKATIICEIDKDLMKGSDVDLALYYYDEDKQLLEKVKEQYIEDNMIFATVYHFSKYVVLDEKEYLSKKNKIKYIDPELIESKGTDYFIHLFSDEDSIYYTEAFCEKQYMLVRNFVSIMEEGDRFSILIKEDGQLKMTEFMDTKEDIYNCLDDMELNRGGVKEGISVAIDEIESDRYRYDGNKNTKRAVISFAPVYGLDAGNDLMERVDEVDTILFLTSIHEKQNTSDGEAYSITTVRPGASSIGIYVKCMEAYTGKGLKSHIEYCLNQKIQYKDLDDDGICDYYENKIALGEITTDLGKCFPNLNVFDKDSDNDGLLDGEEIKVTSFEGIAYIYMYSDPTIADTDGDGVVDSLDPWPLEKHDFTVMSGFMVLRNNESYLSSVLSSAPTWQARAIERDEYYTPIYDDLNLYYSDIVIHHTARNQYEEIEKLEKNEINDDFNGMPYHYVINGDGIIYEGKPLNVMSESVAGNNSNKISIALMGNFQIDENGLKQYIKNALPSVPTDEQFDNMILLIKVLKTQYGIDLIGGHCDYAIGYTTKCPGDILMYMLQKELVWIN